MFMYIIIVPDAPKLKLLPVYSHTEGKLAGIVTTFIESVSINYNCMCAKACGYALSCLFRHHLILLMK